MQQQRPTLDPSTLSRFTGTEHYWRQPFHPRSFVYSDGVRHVAEAGGAYWLIDLIASYQPQLRQHSDKRLHEMQFWHLAVKADRSAVVTCAADAGEAPAISQEISFTDFPLEAVDIWVEGDVALLPSEH